MNAPGSVAPTEDFRRHAEPLGLRRHFRFIVECMLRLAEHQQTFLHETKIKLLRQLLEGGATGETQIAQERRGTLHMLGRRGAPEFKRPTPQAQI
jgi:hypothetical protein